MTFGSAKSRDGATPTFMEWSIIRIHRRLRKSRCQMPIGGYSTPKT